MIFGVATDDSHNYKDFHPTRSNPGRGWIVVQAEALEVEALLEGMSHGRFYASTGVELADLDQSPETISLRVAAEMDFIYTTAFIGHGGKVLQESTGLEASYEPSGTSSTSAPSSGAQAAQRPGPSQS